MTKEERQITKNNVGGKRQGKSMTERLAHTKKGEENKEKEKKEKKRDQRKKR